MALFLPLLFFLLLIPWVRRFQSRASLEAGGWEGSLLIAACLWGAVLTLMLEGLSLFAAVRAGPLTLAWSALVGILIVASLSRNRWREWRLPGWPRLRKGEWAVLGILGLLLLGLLAVAWASPPNNGDSLLYHMARVVRWAQNGSLRHYGTAYGHQLWNPPWAEMAILNARVLWGSDRPANLIQWAGYLGVLIGVSGIARLLDLGRGGRLLAVGFAASIPMAVLQATSTQNDLVTAFWLVAAAYLVLLSRRYRLGRLEIAALGAALGLGLLTKGTFYVFGLAVALWLTFTSPWRARPASAFGSWAAMGAVVIALNFGHWSRNLAAAGSPMGPSDWVSNHGTTTLASLRPKLALYPARMLRGLAQHLAGPWPGWNEAIDSGVKAAYAAFGAEVNASIAVWGWNHEDVAGNPLHLTLITASLGGLAVSQRARRGGGLELTAVGLGAFLLTFLLVSPAITIVGVRLQLPLFILWAPIFAAVVSAHGKESRRVAAAAALTFAAVPWLLFNATRPLIGMRPDPGPLEVPCTDTLGCTRIGSVLRAPRTDVLFANVRESQQAYVEATDALEATSCRQVGLRIDSSDPEYAIWWLLDAPQSGYRLETIYTTPDLEPLLDRDFRPCAILCTICGGRTRLHGLPLAFESGRAKVFLGEGFNWDEDG